MGFAELLALVIGAGMPPAVDVVTRAHWPAWVKLAAAFASSLVIGTLTALCTGEIATAGGWLNVVLVLFAASQVAYRTWWHRDASKAPDAAAG